MGRLDALYSHGSVPHSVIVHNLDVVRQLVEEAPKPRPGGEPNPERMLRKSVMFTSAAGTATERDEPARIGQGGVVGGRTNPVGIDAVEEDEVFFGLGDVEEDPGQELEGGDEGIVIEPLSGFGLVEEEL
jgi:hypothetical protein